MHRNKVGKVRRPPPKVEVSSGRLTEMDYIALRSVHAHGAACAPAAENGLHCVAFGKRSPDANRCQGGMASRERICMNLLYPNFSRRAITDSCPESPFGQHLS